MAISVTPSTASSYAARTHVAHRNVGIKNASAKYYKNIGEKLAHKSNLAGLNFFEFSFDDMF